MSEMISQSRKCPIPFLCAILVLSLLGLTAAQTPKAKPPDPEANKESTNNPDSSKGNPDDPFDVSNQVKEDPELKAPGKGSAEVPAAKKLDTSLLDDLIEFRIKIEPQE